MRTPLPPRHHGYTIIEFSIAVGLLAILLLTAGGVLSSITDGAVEQVARTDLDRDRRIAGQVVAADLNGLQSCDPSRLRRPIVSHSDTTLTITTHAGQSDATQQVTYQLEGSSLTRTAVPDLGDCTFPRGAPEVLLDGISPAGDNGTLFRLWKHGEPLELIAPTVTCDDPVVTSDSCAADLIELHARSSGPDGGEVIWHQKYRIDPRITRLR